MVQYGNCRDGYVVFNINDNLIEGGCNRQVTFFVKSCRHIEVKIGWDIMW